MSADRGGEWSVERAPAGSLIGGIGKLEAVDRGERREEEGNFGNGGGRKNRGNREGSERKERPVEGEISPEMKLVEESRRRA